MEILKTLFRTLSRNKVLSAINLFGLALGMSTCLFIVLYVNDELSYDEHHENLDRIYRVNLTFDSEGGVDKVSITSSPLADHMRKTFPEVEKAVRVIRHDDETVIRVGDVIHKENVLVKADSDLFEVFTYKMLQGNPSTALTQPNSVVLTEAMAKKYFGDEDALGKTMSISRTDHLVTGIIENLPANSDIQFTLVTSMGKDDYKEDWFDFSYYTYFLINKESLESPDLIASLEKKLSKISDEKINGPMQRENPTLTATMQLQPLRGSHFDTQWQYDFPKGNMNYIIIFTAVAVLILIIACLNYINFSIVQSIERSKEVGIRKVVGAGFYQLVFRYIAQSVALTCLALVFAVGIVIILLPILNQVASKDFMLMDLLDVKIISAVVGVVLFVGIVAGSYPAFYTSSIKAVNALKGKVSTPKGQFVRKLSITTQFMISIGLVICTVIAYNQMSFIKDYNVGFRRNNVMAVTVQEDSASYPKFESFRDRLLQLNGISNVSLTGDGALPGGIHSRGSVNVKTEGEDEIRMVNYSRVDANYFPALDIKLKEGRNFRADNISDRGNSVMINEAFVNMMGWKEGVGHKIHWGGGKYADIIGVVRDFHYLSLHNKVEPQLIVMHSNKIINVFIVLEPGDVKDRLALVKDEWNKIFPDEPFGYKFLDETLAAQYVREETAMKVFTYFSVLTVLISCLGLFGLSSLTVYQRKREIGIRKAIGASFRSLIVLFSREYMILISIAIVIIMPVSWYLVNQWLKEFQFQTHSGFGVYAMVAIVILGISMLTIAASVTRISSAKPCDLIKE
jgi:putative ABC transport system permease protein